MSLNISEKRLLLGNPKNIVQVLARDPRERQHPRQTRWSFRRQKRLVFPGAHSESTWKMMV